MNPRLRERFIRDEPSIRLGGIAANLARIESFADHPGHGHVVRRLIRESEFFIEWTVPDTELSAQDALVECQRRLARWYLKWQEIWENTAMREAVAIEVGRWSKRLLELSGLLRQPPGA